MFAIVALATTSQAAMLSGGVSLAGAFTTGTGALDDAIMFTNFSNVSVESGSGSYAGVPVDTAVTQTPFTFNPFPVAGVTPLWTFSDAGTNYSFNLLSVDTILQPASGNFIVLEGTGILNATGFDATASSWTFTGNNAANTFSFSSSNNANANVPDSGATLSLLGAGLIGIIGFRKSCGTRKS